MEETITHEKTLIEQAENAALRLEEANKVTQELIARQEAIEARRVIGGQTQAGVVPVEKTAEQKSTDSARALLKGTGYDDILFPTK